MRVALVPGEPPPSDLHAMRPTSRHLLVRLVRQIEVAIGALGTQVVDLEHLRLEAGRAERILAPDERHNERASERASERVDERSASERRSEFTTVGLDTHQTSTHSPQCSPSAHWLALMAANISLASGGICLLAHANLEASGTAVEKAVPSPVNSGSIPAERAAFISACIVAFVANCDRSLPSGFTTVSPISSSSSRASARRKSERKRQSESERLRVRVRVERGRGRG